MLFSIRVMLKDYFYNCFIFTTFNPLHPPLATLLSKDWAGPSLFPKNAPPGHKELQYLLVSLAGEILFFGFFC